MNFAVFRTPSDRFVADRVADGVDEYLDLLDRDRERREENENVADRPDDDAAPAGGQGDAVAGRVWNRASRSAQSPPAPRRSAAHRAGPLQSRPV